ncbi:MAG: hypothetical protein LBT38_04625 [Deltaproteobacteria bacterium]|jgi:membrane-bound lytic murein transglycosylase D|nr:hypothetical protein [Deltaproteobacteria bacterium]
MKRLFIGAFFLALTIILGTSLKAEDRKFAGQAVPLDRPEVAEGVDQELLLLSEAKSRVWLTLRRSAKYLPIIDTALSKTGVSADFRYLPMTLTSLSPTYQVGGRAGLWRLSANEAKAMGLVISRELDERLDPVAASLASATKIKNLEKSLGSPVMALAAFIDENATRAAMAAAANETNYFRLYCPESLEKAVFQVLAGQILFSAPQVYGYNLTKTWPNLAKKRQKVTAPQDLRALASQNNLDHKSFRDLNPHILGETIPVGAFVYLP